MKYDLSNLITENNITQVRQAAEHALQNGHGVSKPADELNGRSARIQELLERIEQCRDPEASALMQDCLQEILGFYGAGLERILDLIAQTNGHGEGIMQRILTDEFLSGLLLIHDLHPMDLETRVYEALEMVRPYMESHGGNVEVVSVEDGNVHLRLQGSCKGCPSSSVTLDLALKDALEAKCPDIVNLQVEGVIEAAGKNPADVKESVWTEIPHPDMVAEGSIRQMTVDGVQVIICNAEGQLYAYRDVCPACEMSLASGNLEGTVLRCKLGHDFDIRLAGRCPDDPTLHLDPFPLITKDRKVRVSVR